MASTREVMAIVRYPGRNGYIAEIFYRIKEENRVRIVTERIIEPYEANLDKLPLDRIRWVKENARKRLEQKLKKVRKGDDLPV